MGTRCFIDVDLADIFSARGRKQYLRTLAWGDEVVVTKQASTHLEVEVFDFEQQPDGSILPSKKTGYIEPSKSSGRKAKDVVKPRSQNRVLKVNFVDVQQGDGAVIETPDGQVILVDGGDNQLFARYLAGRFRGTSLAKPQPVECILVTHGDADHFAGLPKILDSETNSTPRKRLFIEPRRVYHNGIVKGPSKKNGKSVPDAKLLGKTKKVDGDLYIVDLKKNLLDVPDAELNEPFLKWKQALATWHKRKKIEFRRLELGDEKAFDFLGTDGLRIEVLGPLTREVAGEPALPFLGNPPKGPRIGHESLDAEHRGFSGNSASHTINGHSIVFRLVYGGIRYLFSGDLNDEAGRTLVQRHNHGDLSLTAEVLKVPHHGSADFSGAFIQAASPIVSVVSSGDENPSKEYIHPRATLMGALGKWSRVPEPLIFVTELVAFFNTEGWALPKDPKQAKKRGEFFAFSRTAFGMVKTRTDGKRLFVYTDSGNMKMKEAYAYELDVSGAPQPAAVVRV